MGADGKAGAGLNDQAIQWLVALDCGTADSAAFEAWRNSDPRHAAAFAQVAATWRRTADPRLAAALDHPAQASTDEPQRPAPRAVSRRAVAGGIAATIGIGGAGGFLLWPRRASAATAVGERRTIALPDGSNAMLNTDTRVSWRFDDGRDFRIEQGEATLLVHAAAHPFRLYSDPIDARLGEGKFDIRLGSATGRLLVLAGRAATAYRGTLAETLQAGSMLTVGDGTTRIDRLSPDAIAAATAWERGEIRFNGMALDQAVAEFNRYLPDKIVLQNPDLASTRLGGTFQVADPQTFLLALHEGFGIGHRRDGDRILLFRDTAR